MSDDLEPRLSGEEAAARFGACREPSMVQEWEREKVPVSKVELDGEVGKTLEEHRKVSSCTLLKSSAKCLYFIWAMDADCRVFIAYEEIAPDESADVMGAQLGMPRIKHGNVHPADVKKLGHPTLVNGGVARVAGELFLDDWDDKLSWFVNVGSGRYCRSLQPTQANCDGVLGLFRELIGVEVQWDEL